MREEENTRIREKRDEEKETPKLKEDGMKKTERKREREKISKNTKKMFQVAWQQPNDF